MQLRNHFGWNQKKLFYIFSAEFNDENNDARKISVTQTLGAIEVSEVENWRNHKLVRKSFKIWESALELFFFCFLQTIQSEGSGGGDLPGNINPKGDKLDGMSMPPPPLIPPLPGEYYE